MPFGPIKLFLDASLAMALKALRHALGDTGHAQRLIETVKGRALRMAVPVFPLVSSHVKTEAEAQAFRAIGAAPSLAILRFTAPSKTLGRTISADLISALSASRELQVIARGSSFRFLSGEAYPAKLREKCRADFALSGHIEGP